jgi:hypothetical protein
MSNDQFERIERIYEGPSKPNDRLERIGRIYDRDRIRTTERSQIRTRAIYKIIDRISTYDYKAQHVALLKHSNTVRSWTSNVESLAQYQDWVLTEQPSVTRFKGDGM